jgi:hypothetical protein
MYAEFARFVGTGGDHAAGTGTGPDDDGSAFQGGIVPLFHRSVKSVHVDMKNYFFHPASCRGLRRKIDKIK